MSDVSQGPGWWQASDGKWYAAEERSTELPPPPAGASRPDSPAEAASSKTNLASFSFDMKRWAKNERVTAVATLALFIALFLPWFTYNYGIGTASVDGLWHGWMYIVLILCLAILTLLVARAGFREAPFKLPLSDERVLLLGTGVNVVLTVLAFVFKPGGFGSSGIGWGFGAFVGLIASVVAAAPFAVPAYRARRP